ncbi:MAG: hypothetical protein FWE39_13675 [Nocardiaceae bacterium]|nr:hypothetical protein [Nocardiaceae bacterium]
MNVRGLVVPVIVTAIAALAFWGVSELREAAQYGGGTSDAAQLSVVFRVETTQSFLHEDEHAAMSLWNSCLGDLPGDADTVPTRHADGTFSAVVRPGYQEDTRRRLRGCLEDLTIDTVRASVLWMSEHPVADLYDASDRVRAG